MMWHEARKQEKKIRGMIVDYHRRAERRRDYYEKIKADPTQFLQIHGRPCKIHLDPAVAAAGDSPANMMPWQGQTDNLIDRFDVRAHLDFIPQPHDDEEDSPNTEERQANYERYRILVQNEFLGVPEEKFLRQLYLEEQFGPVGGLQSKEPPPNPDKKGKKVPGAAIGYVYDDDGAGTVPSPTSTPSAKQEKDDSKTEENAEEEDEDSDVDFDMCLDISKIDTKQAHEMNRCGLGYGMSGNDFFSFLTDDFEEQEALKLAREQEEEKAMFAGRKSRRERRAFREKKLVGRKISPPSYATRSSPTYDPYRMSPNSRSKSKSQSRSRSTSPVNTGVIQYITSFGDEEDAAVAGLSSDKQLSSAKLIPKVAAKRTLKRSHSSSSDVSTLRRSKRRSRSRSRSRSWSRSRGRRRKRSSSRSSRSYSRSLSRSRSRSGSRSRKRSSSSVSSQDSHYYSRRSRSRNRSHSARRQRSCSSRSRSPSRSRKRGYSESLRNSRSPNLNKRKGTTDQPSQPQQPVQRYYGRRKGDSSSSDLEASDSEEPSAPSVGVGTSSGSTLNKTNRSGSGNTRPAAKVSNSGVVASTTKITPQERLKKKMQALLNRQYKADKKAEKARLEKAEQERNDRKEELRELALKMRRRERQKRHKMRDGDQDSDSDLEDRSQWSSGSSDSHSDKSSPTRSRRSHSHSPDNSKAMESKHNKWMGDVPNRSTNDDKKNQRDERGKEERFKKEENYRRQDANSLFKNEENYYREDGASYRRDDNDYYRDGSSYRRDNINHRREDNSTYKRDDAHGGPSRFETYNRRDFGNRRHENDGYRGREDSQYRGGGGGRGDWNRRDDNYGKSRYGSQRREDEQHNYNERRNEHSRPKLVDY